MVARTLITTADERTWPKDESEPVLFLGDRRLDHEVASFFNFDFIFISQWTEFRGWNDYCCQRELPVVLSIADLLVS